MEVKKREIEAELKKLRTTRVSNLSRRIYDNTYDTLDELYESEDNLLRKVRALRRMFQ